MDANAAARFRCNAKGASFVLNLSRLMISTLQHYRESSSPPTCAKQLKAADHMVKQGLLEPGELTADEQRLYHLADPGRAILALLDAAEWDNGDDGTTEPVDTEFLTSQQKFRMQVQGPALSLVFSQSAIEAMDHYRRQSGAQLGCRRQRDSCHKLVKLGYLDLLPDTDNFGRNVYEITDIGLALCDVLLQADYLKPLPTKTSKPRRKAVAR